MSNSPAIQLEALSGQLSELVALCETLRVENQTLKTKQESLMNERATLIEKNELAKSKVEAMIMRLKSLEAPQ